MSGTLFGRARLSDVIRNSAKSIQSEIDIWERNKVLAASESDLVNYLVDKYSLDAPTLLPRDQWESSAEETKVDVSHDFSRAPLPVGRRMLIPGHQVSVRVPFEGDADLFDFLPSTHNSNPPRAEVSKPDSVLTFTVTVPHDDADAKRVHQEIDREVINTESYLNSVRQDCDAWNARLPDVAADYLNARKRRLLQQADLLSELGIPLRRRDGGNGVFSVPVARRTRPTLRTPATPTAAFQPEPTIAQEDYHFILKLIDRLAISIEQNPATFVRLPEEHIRDHILVSLNGHFEGGATGETFNANGKTDILIREEGANVFIGECKFWSGPKALHRAIDQLLGYATWRDTKTALVLFSRNRNFARVLQTIDKCVPEHPEHKRTLHRVSETQFRYVFGQKDDTSREVHLAILAFHIPSTQAA